jgi:hypothetical protein
MSQQCGRSGSCNVDPYSSNIGRGVARCLVDVRTPGWAVNPMPMEPGQGQGGIALTPLGVHSRQGLRLSGKFSTELTSPTARVVRGSAVPCSPQPGS